MASDDAAVTCRRSQQASSTIRSMRSCAAVSRRFHRRVACCKPVKCMVASSLKAIRRAWRSL
eukprot:12891669-Prorocentrum_lima.AAC.1